VLSAPRKDTTAGRSKSAAFAANPERLPLGESFAGFADLVGVAAGMSVDQLNQLGAVQLSEARMGGTDRVKGIAAFENFLRGSIPGCIKIGERGRQGFEAALRTDYFGGLDPGQAIPDHREEAQLLIVITLRDDGCSTGDPSQKALFDDDHVLDALQNGPAVWSRFDRCLLRGDIASGFEKVPAAGFEDREKSHANYP
jgi:hypothetical protein